MDKKTPLYVIDACSLLVLNNTYPSDVFPGAWDLVEDLASTGVMISSEEILSEISVIDDDLNDWAQNFSGIFYPLEEEIQSEASKILGAYPNLLDLKKHKSGGDPFLIATAIVYNCVVVTEEKPSGDGSKLVKIPNVCNAYGIKYMNLLELLRTEGLKLDRRS